MRLLVVGVNGALGGVTAREALAAGHMVDGVHHSRRNRLPAGLGTVVADTALSSLGRDSYDAVLIAAGFVPYSRMDEPDARLADANVDLPLRVCRAFPGVRVVYASSVAVYGEPSGVLSETSAFVRPSLYGLSKLAGETVVRQHASHAVVRFSSLYGSAMTATTFLPHLVATARTGRPLTVFGDGSRRQDYLHLTDAAHTLLAAAGCPTNGVFLGVHGTSFTNLDVARRVASVFPGGEVTTAGTDASPSFVFDAAWTRSKLAFVPRVSLDEGIRELVGHGG